MKSIYILLTHSSTVISKLIRVATSDVYTHASIAFDESLQPLYSFSRKFVRIPLPAGLKAESFDKGLYKINRHMPCALFELKVEDEIYFMAKREVESMMDKSNTYHFNIIGLFLCRLGISFHREYNYFCSEFVSEILSKSNAVVLPKKPSLMRPGDYTNISGLNCCFEGKLDKLIVTMPHAEQSEPKKYSAHCMVGG